jgi:carbonic anhydrase/acetyltransferase-like protein (isoleucine patch superfamily)
MPMFAFEDKSPIVHPDAWIAPTATLIGDVTIEAHASVWYGAVIRADFAPVIVREGANVQDNTVIHVATNGCEIGRGATIGHLCVIHDCTIGEQAVIGNASVILDGARVGPRTMVAANSTVTPGKEVPGEVVTMGSPAKRQEPLSDTARLWVDHNPGLYQELARRHRASAELIEG